MKKVCSTEPGNAYRQTVSFAPVLNFEEVPEEVQKAQGC